MSFDFDFTAEKLAACVRRNHHVAELYEAMCEVLPRYEITSVDRVAAFLAQCGHESADFTILQENLKYTAEQLHRVWPSRFPTVESAQPYNRNAEAIANKVYSGRMGNGDEASGEGWLYRGRGAIQLTGKSNYTAFANHIGQSLEQAVAYTETLAGAVESAAFFWHRNGLNALADNRDNTGMTKRINGGTLGLEERKQHYIHNLQVLGGEAVHHEPAASETQSQDNWPTLRMNSPHHDWVKALQEKLGLPADGQFGPGTDAALKHWQTANGLTADGIAGPNTLRKLFG